ncbi:MAG: response regulator transcription factor [Alphaproteobacteria bacterium]
MAGKPSFTVAMPEWHSALAMVVKHLNSTEFPGRLINALSKVVKFNHSVVFAYRGTDQPLALYDTFTPEQQEVFVTMYQAGPYLLDPFYQAYRNKTASGLYRIKQLAPDRFYQSEYFRSYYVQTGLKEEIGFLLDVPGGIRIVISLMRLKGSPLFSEREMALLHGVEPVVRALANRHWHNLEHGWSGKPWYLGMTALETQIDNAFQDFGRSILTPRECEVVGMVLRGHSSDSISQQLEIAQGTVKIHRKNIYKKLRISSQSELFSLFISSLYTDDKKALIIAASSALPREARSGRCQRKRVGLRNP